LKYFFRLCSLLFVLAPLQQCFPQSLDRISQQQLLAWAIGGMTEEHLLAQIKQRGIESYDDNLLTALHSSGTADSVLSKIRENKLTTRAPGQGSATLLLLLKAAKSVERDDNKLAYENVLQALKVDPKNADLHYAAAGILRKVEDWEDAATEYRLATQLAPEFADAYQGLAYMYYRMGEGNRAVLAAKQALKLQPNDSDGHKTMGLSLEGVDNLDGALAEYAEALRLNPANAAVYYDRGIILSRRKDYVGAAAAYKKATELRPSDWHYWYNSGVNLDHKGDTEGAIAAYIRAKELNPNALEVRQNLGAQYCESKRYAQAISEFRELLKMDPSWNMARFCLFKSLHEINDLDEAIKVGEESLRYEPEDTWMLSMMEGLYVSKGRNSEAEDLFARHVIIEERNNAAKNPDLAAVLGRRANLFASEKKFEAADADYKRALEIIQKAEPGSKQVNLEQMRRERQEMLRQWRSESTGAVPSGISAPPPSPKAATVSAKPQKTTSIPTPSNADARWQAQRMLAQKATFERRFADAELALKQALKDAAAIVPQGNQVLFAMQDLVNLYMQEQKFDLAEEIAKQAVAKSEEQFGKQSMQIVMPLNSLAGLYMLQSKFHDAELLYARSLKIVEDTAGPRDPQLGMALDNLGENYASQRMFEQAEPLIKKYLTISEEYYGPDGQLTAVPIDHLGALYVLWHKYDLAEPLYRRALAMKEKQFGTNSPMLNGSLYTLAEILRNLGRPAEAQALEARRDALSNSNKN
jgi:tetratricopeptide (TPR) repeat protein